MDNQTAGTLTQIGFTLVGYYIGGPFGGMVGAALGAYVAGQFFGGPDTEVSRGRLQDLKVNTSRYGNPIPAIWGCYRVGGTPYFNSDLIEQVHKEEAEGGGKGGGSSVTTKSYYYAINIGYKLAASPQHYPVTGVLKIWANGKLIADYTNTTSPVISAKYKTAAGGPFDTGTIRIRLGEEDQEPDPLYVEVAGQDAPGDRGDCTLILEQFPLRDFGNAAPQITALVCTAAVDVYPIEFMPEWLRFGARFAWHPNGRWIYYIDDNDGPEFVNSDTREFVIAPDEKLLENFPGSGNADGGFFRGFQDIDDRGRGLTWAASLTHYTVGIHDVETYEIIARGAHTGSGIFPSGSAARFFNNGNRAIFTGNSGQTFHIYNTGGFGVATDPPLTFNGPLMESVIGPVLWADYGLATNPCWVTDGDDNLWTLHNTGASDCTLVKWSPNGAILTSYLISGRRKDGVEWDSVGYDAASNSFIVVENVTTLWRWDIEDEAVHPTILTITTTNDTAQAMRMGTVEGKLYLQSGTFGPNLQVIDVPTMTIDKTYNILANWGEGNTRAPLYDPYLNAVVMTTTGGNLRWIFLDRLNADGVTLESILDDEVLRAGYFGGSADADASDHSAVTVLGWASNRQGALTGETQAQADVYKFGHVESDHKIKFPARGRATSFALTDDDLGVISFGDEAQKKILINRIDQSDLPLRTELNFMDPDLEYQEGLQRVSFPPDVLPGTLRDESRNYNVVLTNDEAKQRAFIHLQQMFSDQQRYRFTTFHSELQIDPGDTGTVTVDNLTHLIMVEQVQLGANFIYEVTGVGFTIANAAEADAILTQLYTLEAAIIGQGSEAGDDQQIPGINLTNLVLLDLPYLRDSVDPGNARILTQVVAQRLSTGILWPGASILRSADNSNFSDWMFYPEAVEGEIGTTNTVLPAPEKYTVIDEDSTVTVSFRSDLVLASVTDAELFDGENAFLIGSELIRAGVLTDDGDGVWTLSRLLRGRRGTDSVMGDHTAFERVIYLGHIEDDTKGSAKSVPLSELNTLYYYKGLTLDSVNPSTLVRQFTNMGGSLKPYAPAQVKGVKSGSDWSISWVPRTRLDGELRDGSGGAAADPEAFEVDILDTDGVTVLRTITSTASANGSVVSGRTATYDQLDIEADFGESPVVSGNPLYQLWVRVYHINDVTVGRGFTKDTLLEDYPDPTPADANFSSVVLLCHCDSLTVKDKSQYKHPLIVGSGVSFAEGFSKYGSGALKFDNTANGRIDIDRLRMQDHFDFGSGDFTIEAWLNVVSEEIGVICALWGSSPQRSWRFYLSTAVDPAIGSLIFEWSTNGSNDLDLSCFNVIQPNMGPVHVAAVVESSVVSVYVDGARVGTTGIGTIFTPTTPNFTIGIQESASGNPFINYIDSIRITKGVARYSGTTYTVPTHRFSNY